MEYQKNLESIERTKEFKHDYRGLLMTLSVHLENNQTEDALNLLNKIKAYSRTHLPSHQIEYIQLINNIPIQSVLLTKLKLADELDIPVEIDCNTILLGNIDLFDFLRMLNILLDNAIEECTDQTCPLIQVYLKEFKDAVTLQVENSVSDEKLQIPLSKFTEKNYSTKGANRGKGLFNLTKLAAKYTNVFVQFQVNSVKKTFQASIVVKKYH
ncbi:GHKL domain-containing protein [Listeria rocourtiae]|uniref:sensor histidine kinase n=1 Tax=Listeria rocourtiae TaxID=647910 RepID=UPI003D2F68AF